MNQSEETQEINPSENTQKLDALLKEYELVELEIDNHQQNMSTMGSLFVTALVILIGFIIKDQKHVLLLIIPFFLCITSVYLLNQKRTLTFDTFYAEKIEYKINTLIRSDKTIYFEHMSYRMWTARSDMEWTIGIASIAVYFGALFYYDLLVHEWSWDLKCIVVLIVVYHLVLAYITFWHVLIPAWVFTEWSEELKVRIEDEDLSISNLDGKIYLINKKLSNFKKGLIGRLVGAFRR